MKGKAVTMYERNGMNPFLAGEVIKAVAANDHDRLALLAGRKSWLAMIREARTCLAA